MTIAIMAIIAYLILSNVVIYAVIKYQGSIGIFNDGVGLTIVASLFFAGIPLNWLHEQRGEEHALKQAHRLEEFRNRFLFNHDGTFEQEDLEAVQRTLRRSSEHFHTACARQEEARRNFKRLKISQQDLDLADRQVELDKAVFWRTHALAKSFGYPVKESSVDYLPNGRPPILHDSVQE